MAIPWVVLGVDWAVCEAAAIRVYRHGQDYRLVIEEGEKEHEFYIVSPKVFLDREFITRYDGTGEA